MRYYRILILLLGGSMFYTPATAQTLYGFLGAGVGYDAFLRDKAVTRYKNEWPFELGVQTVIGLRYQTGQSFDAMLDISMGSLRVKFPVPEGYESRAAYQMMQSIVMIGSGIHVSVDEHNIIMPFMQIGAGFYDHSGYAAMDRVDIPGGGLDRNTSRWMPVVGAGVDWQSRLIVPASFNLRFIYTPLSFYEDPLDYTFSTSTNTENLLLQGKMLQTILTFRVYLRMVKWPERY